MSAFASLPQLPLSTLQVMRRCLLGRQHEASMLGQDAREQLAAIDAEIARREARPPRTMQELVSSLEVAP